MALADFFEPFVRQVHTQTPDGLGGVTDEWTDGAAFQAGISTSSSDEMRIAEQRGLKTVYTIVTETGFLTQGDRVKRVRDGAVFIITSNGADMTTPAVAQVQYAQVSAERWEAGCAE